MQNFLNQFNQKNLVDELKAAATDTEALLNATAHTGGEKVAEVRAKVEDSLNSAKRKLENIQDETIAKTKVATQAADAYVRDNPWRSLGLAASLGVVIGLLIGRR